jgi:hypothetical protein
VSTAVADVSFTMFSLSPQYSLSTFTGQHNIHAVKAIDIDHNTTLTQRFNLLFFFFFCISVGKGTLFYRILPFLRQFFISLAPKLIYSNYAKNIFPNADDLLYSKH